jgi:folate-binding protein YgfZ
MIAVRSAPPSSLLPAHSPLRQVAVFAPDERVLHLQGDDAQSWLNGQVTTDLSGLGADDARYVLAVNVKGRVLSDAWLRARAGALSLVLPRERVPLARESFDKHIIMEDVELVLDEDLRVLTVQGPRAAQLLEQAGLTSGAYRADRLGLDGFDVWVAEGELAALRARLVQAAQQMGGGALDEAAWSQAHVLLAVPRCGVDFGEQSYPQEAGLKARAVSFNKGCYLGQEVICMLENRGQLNRRLVQLEHPGHETVATGSQAFDAEGKRVGELTSGAVTDSPALATLALAYLKRPLAEPGTRVRVGDREWAVRAVVGSNTDECPIVAR